MKTRDEVNKERRAAYVIDPESIKERNAAWYKKNSKKRILKAKEWSQANPSKRKEICLKWIRNNTEYVNRVHREWMKNHPEVRVRNEAARRTRKTQAGGTYTRTEWERLKRKYRGASLCCGKKKTLTPDHVIPVAKGGRSSIDNIQPLCLKCNQRKGIKTTD